MVGFAKLPLICLLPCYANDVELAKPMGLRALNPPYEMINFSEYARRIILKSVTIFFTLISWKLSILNIDT